MHSQSDTELLSRFDKDPGRFRPMQYNLLVSVPVLVNGIGRGSISINNQPYIWTYLTHGIVGDVSAGTGLFQDNQYLISVRDEQSNYQDMSGLALTQFGDANSGRFLPLPYPIPYSGNKTITFEIQNLYNRVIVGDPENFQVQLTMRGVADWGII